MQARASMPPRLSSSYKISMPRASTSIKLSSQAPLPVFSSLLPPVNKPSSVVGQSSLLSDTVNMTAASVLARGAREPRVPRDRHQVARQLQGTSLSAKVGPLVGAGRASRGVGSTDALIGRLGPAAPPPAGRREVQVAAFGIEVVLPVANLEHVSRDDDQDENGESAATDWSYGATIIL